MSFVMKSSLATQWYLRYVYISTWAPPHCYTLSATTFLLIMFPYDYINNSSLFKSMSNLILININVTDMKRHMLMYFFIFMLVSKEWDEIVLKRRISYYEKKSEVIEE